MNATSPRFLRRNPDFILLWLGQIFSQSGGRMYQMTMIWWILSNTVQGSGKAIGAFMVTAALPSLLFVSKIGKLIDRTRSQRLLIFCDFAACLIILTISLFLKGQWLNLPWIFVAGFVTASLQAFIDPTLNKSVTEVASPQDTEQAVALLSSTQSMANFAGAVAGAMLIERLGIPLTVLLAACGYLISSICTATARFRFAKTQPKAIEEQRSGWKLLEHSPLLKKLLLGFGCINFFATPTLVILPLYTKWTLKGNANLLGTLEASLWVGLIGGTFASKWIQFSESRIRTGAVCLSVMGLGLLVPGLFVGKVLYLAMLALVGFALGVNNVKFLSFFQEIVPAGLKGRFFALMQATISFTFPIAYFLFGAMTDYVTPPEVCLVQGIGVITLSLFFLTLAKSEKALEFKMGEPALA